MTTERRLVPGAEAPIAPPPQAPPMAPPTADNQQDDTESVELQMRQQCDQKRGRAKIKNK